MCEKSFEVFCSSRGNCAKSDDTQQLAGAREYKFETVKNLGLRRQKNTCRKNTSAPLLCFKPVPRGYMLATHTNLWLNRWQFSCIVDTEGAGV